MALHVAITIDVHPNDDVTSILRCNEFFLYRNIPVTFLISTAILERKNTRSALMALQNKRYELGTHGHDHGFEEIHALNSGINHRLEFLRRSKAVFEDVFGKNPLSFRSPSWCGLGGAAIDELARLEYCVDCSATPQRPGFLSNLPLKSPWLFTPRRPHWLRRSLLEIPTSTFLLPLASPTFAMLRKTISLVFLKCLIMEARRSREKVLVLDFDTQDFDPTRPYGPPSRAWRELVPRRYGGFQWRYWLRTYKPERLYSTAVRLIDLLSDEEFVTLSEIFEMTFKDAPEQATTASVSC